MSHPEHATDELVHCRMAIYSQADAEQRMDYALRLQDPGVRSRNILRPEELGRIVSPTLVLSGDADRIVPPRTSLRLSRYIPDASYSEIGPAALAAVRAAQAVQRTRPDVLEQRSVPEK